MASILRIHRQSQVSRHNLDAPISRVYIIQIDQITNSENSGQANIFGTLNQDAV